MRELIGDFADRPDPHFESDDDPYGEFAERDCDKCGQSFSPSEDSQTMCVGCELHELDDDGDGVI